MDKIATKEAISAVAQALNDKINENLVNLQSTIGDINTVLQSI